MTIETVTSETLAEFNQTKMGVAHDLTLEVDYDPRPEVKAEGNPPADAPNGDVKTDEPGEPAPKKGNHKLESRFSELTAKVRMAEEKAAAAEARAAAAEAKANPKPAEAQAEAAIVGPEPKPGDYADAFEYAKDLAEWSTNQALLKRDKEDAEKRQNETKRKVIDSFTARVEAFKTEKEDWADMVASSQAFVSDPARDAIIESEFGPRLMYELAQDDDLAKKVSAMTPAGQLVWIGKMEAKYEAVTASASEPEAKETAEPIKERPRAPAPITPVKGTRGVDNPVSEPGEFKGTFKQWKEARKRQGAQFA